MLFRKRMERSCAYCVYGTKLDEDTVLCIKRGTKSIDSKCRKFKYDPCKRVPLKAKALDFSQYESLDYSL